MLRSEDRGASEVIGAVLIFGFLVIAFSIYQGVVVPQQNRAIEFEHNEMAQNSMQDLRNAIRQTASTGAEEAVSIKLGADYPERVLAVNPGVSAGSLQTQPLGTIAIENVSATDPEVEDYFGATTSTLGPFESKTLVYRPIYFQYTNAPDTHYENTLAYNAFPNGVNLSITDQAVVDGRKLMLVALDGNVSAAQQGAVTVDTQAVSTATNTVAVSDAGGPITITLATRLTAANWTELLEDELDTTGTEPEKFVSAIEQTGPNQVSITLEAGVTYELRLAKVGIGTDTADTAPKYLVDVEGDDTSVAESGTQKLVVEVRDRFNNPVSNVSVTAAIQPDSVSGDSVSGSPATTDADGRATFIYHAPPEVDGAQDVDIEASFDDGVPPADTGNETVTFDVRVLDADGSGGDDGGGSSTVNPSAEQETLVYVNATVRNGGSDEITLWLNNTGDSAITIEEARFQFYSINNPGSDNQPPESIEINGVEIPYLGPFTSIGAVTIQPGKESLSPSFDHVDGGGFTVRGSDFFILTIRTSSGDTITYYIGIIE